MRDPDRLVDAVVAAAVLAVIFSCAGAWLWWRSSVPVSVEPPMMIAGERGVETDTIGSIVSWVIVAGLIVVPLGLFIWRLIKAGKARQGHR